MLSEGPKRTKQADTLRTAARRPRLGSHAGNAAAGLAACIVLACPGRAALQNNIVQGMIPAFYQHQGDNGPAPKPTSITPSMNAIWIPDKGWCAYVSDMDALYPWETLTVAGVHPFDNTSVSLFGAPGAGVGSDLTSAGTWLDTADDTVIPALKAAGKYNPVLKLDVTMNNYLTQQKVGPSNLGPFGLVDTQYQTLANGQVQVATIAGWKNVTPNTFTLYQQLTSTGGYLPAVLQPLAAITTTIRIGYANGNSQATTELWWGFHQVAGAGVAGANSIQYSDPDAIPINAGNRNGGFTQAAVNNNEYNKLQQGGPPPLPGNGLYATNNLYSTMQISPSGQVTGGNGPYDLMRAGKPTIRVTNIDAVSLIAAQIANIVVKPLYDAVSFLFSGNFGGDVTKLEIFANSPLYASNLGLSENDPDWTISQVMTDPYGNSWASTDGGILLAEGAGGSDLMEDGADYLATEDTTGAVTGFTVFAYDQSDGYWLTETYGPVVGYSYSGAQAVPETPTWLLMLLGAGCTALIALRRRRETGLAL
jgi:hypothetical protein